MLLTNKQLKIILNGEEIDGFHLDVSYSFNADTKDPATANINLYNYEKDIDGGDIIIKAGYNDNLYEVFQGIITNVRNIVRRNEDTYNITITNALDSYRRVLEPSKINKGTSLKDFISTIASKSKLKVGTLDLPNVQVNRDYSLHKYPVELIKNLSDSFGFYFMIDSTKTLHCYSSSTNTAFLLNSETGLLDYELNKSIIDLTKSSLPADKTSESNNTRISKPVFNKKTTSFSARCLFIPTLALNNKVVLEDQKKKIKIEGMVTKMSVNLNNYSDVFHSNLDEVKVL